MAAAVPITDEEEAAMTAPGEEEKLESWGGEWGDEGSWVDEWGEGGEEELLENIDEVLEISDDELGPSFPGFGLVDPEQSIMGLMVFT